MLKNGRVLFRSLTTPDGTELISHHRHDYVTHVDKVNGRHYMLDGGLDYCRCSTDANGIFTVLTDSDDFETIRRHFTRGTRGKDGNEPLRWIPLAEMTNEHLEATIEYCFLHRATAYIDIYEEELKYRYDRGLIEDSVWLKIDEDDDGEISNDPSKT